MQGTAHGSLRAHFKAQGRASPAAPGAATLVPKSQQDRRSPWWEMGKGIMPEPPWRDVAVILH